MLFYHLNSGFDNSDVPIHAVIKNIIDLEEAAPKGFVVGISGGLKADMDAKFFENVENYACDKELSCGKHHKQANHLYVNNFWHHNNC